MSYRPNAFAGSLPTADVCPLPPLLPNAPGEAKWASFAVSFSPQLNAVLVPARQAYSHSASVGRRYW